MGKLLNFPSGEEIIDKEFKPKLNLEIESAFNEIIENCKKMDIGGYTTGIVIWE